MNGELITIIIIGLIWLIRLEIKSYNLKIGRHYKLYDENFHAVSHLNSDGTLAYSITGSNLMSYKTASGIKKLYLELRMVNKMTGKEVF